MPARQFPIDKTPLVQPLMRAVFPGPLVDRQFLPVNCLPSAHSAGPNHVSAHGIEPHGIEDFRVVRNLGHRIAPFCPGSATTRSCAPRSDSACLKPRDRVDPGGPREPYFFATLCLCCNDAADCRCSASGHARVAAVEQGESRFESRWIA